MQSEKNIKGLILDLRNNPGGYLTDAVFISSEFLKQGSPVVYAGRRSRSKNDSFCWKEKG